MVETCQPTCKISEGVCSCKNDYIGKTECNSATRWGEYDNPMYNS